MKRQLETETSHPQKKSKIETKTTLTSRLMNAFKHITGLWKSEMSSEKSSTNENAHNNQDEFFDKKDYYDCESKLENQESQNAERALKRKIKELEIELKRISENDDQLVKNSILITSENDDLKKTEKIQSRKIDALEIEIKRLSESNEKFVENTKSIELEVKTLRSENYDLKMKNKRMLEQLDTKMNDNTTLRQAAELEQSPYVSNAHNVLDNKIDVEENPESMRICKEILQELYPLSAKISFTNIRPNEYVDMGFLPTTLLKARDLNVLNGVNNNHYKFDTVKQWNTKHNKSPKCMSHTDFNRRGSYECGKALSTSNLSENKSILCEGIPEMLHNYSILKDHFKMFGNITKIEVNKGLSNNAIVHFKDAASAKKAKINGKMIMNNVPPIKTIRPFYG